MVLEKNIFFSIMEKHKYLKKVLSKMVICTGKEPGIINMDIIIKVPLNLEEKTEKG